MAVTMNRLVEVLLVASFAFTSASSAIAQPPSPCVTGGAVKSSTAVTTYHYDNLRTGWNCNETILTPSIVGLGAKKGGFGLHSTTSLDEQVDGQPLFVPKQTVTAGVNLIPGAKPGTYDVVYVATEGNSIYAIDASTGNVLLHKAPSGLPAPPFTYLGTPVSQSNLPGTPPCGNASNSVGINGTPVIDIANDVMYVIVYSQTPKVSTPKSRQDFDFFYHLHELDLSSLEDLAPPLLVSASHPIDKGTTNVLFDAGFERQRPALLFIPGASGNGNLYAGFGSFCDQGGSTGRGWLLGWQPDRSGFFSRWCRRSPSLGVS